MENDEEDHREMDDFGSEQDIKEEEDAEEQHHDIAEPIDCKQEIKEEDEEGGEFLVQPRNSGASETHWSFTAATAGVSGVSQSA